MDYKAAAQASDGDGWTLALRRAALGGQRLNVATHTHTLTQLLGERQVRERCLGDESVKHYSSSVWGSPGVEGRLTGWVICILLRREEGRGRRGARDEGWGGGTERWRWGHTHSHTEQCTLVYCVCLRQWQSVYHVAINLPTITLWCPGWRPQTGVSLTPAHFRSRFMALSLSSPPYTPPDLCRLPKLVLVKVWHVALYHQEMEFRIILRHWLSSSVLHLRLNIWVRFFRIKMSSLSLFLILSDLAFFPPICVNFLLVFIPLV